MATIPRSNTKCSTAPSGSKLTIRKESKNKANNGLHQSNLRSKTTKAYILDKTKIVEIDSKATNKYQKIYQSDQLPVSKKINRPTQNFTVSSPPIKRKLSNPILEHSSKNPTTRDRTRTRTLKPEEVSILRSATNVSDKTTLSLRPPIFFEVSLNEPKSSIVPDPQATQDVNGEDDQYESDFESESSSMSSCSNSSKSSLFYKSTSSDCKTSCKLTSLTNVDQYQWNLTRASNLDQDKKECHDSGQYDTILHQEQSYNDVFFGSSIQQVVNQPDSGINSDIFDFQTTNISSKQIHKRKTDILNKISLNVMFFNLFEEQPATYDYFVKFYANITSVQNQCQTETEVQEMETQTDDVYYKSSWIQTSSYYLDKTRDSELCVGCDESYFCNDNLQRSDPFSNFLRYLEKKKPMALSLVQQSIVYEKKLLSFLQNSLPSIERILRKISDISQNSTTIDLTKCKILSQSSVISAYPDPNYSHIFFTFHDYHKDTIHHQRFICIWNKRYLVHPKTILFCWDNITCLERIGSIFIGGTQNGALCLWHEQEHKTETTPFQIITLDISSNVTKYYYGKVSAVKSVAQYRSCKNRAFGQVLTLFEEGILVTWSSTLVTHEAVDDGASTTQDIIFFGARYKLIQQCCINLFNFAIHKTMLILPNKHSKYYENENKENWLNSTNEGQTTSLMTKFPLFTNMLVYQNKAIISFHGFLLIANIFENKCILILKNGDLRYNFLQTISRKDFIITLSTQGLIKMLKVHSNKKIWPKNKSDATDYLSEQQNTSSNMKFEELLSSNKSCTIQNIVQNERKLHRSANRYNNIPNRKPSSNSKINIPDFNKHLVPADKATTFYHNQVFFLKQINTENMSLLLLDGERLICVGNAECTKLINLKSGREKSLIDGVALNFRLLGTTNKEMIYTTGDQNIYLLDVSTETRNISSS